MSNACEHRHDSCMAALRDIAFIKIIQDGVFQFPTTVSVEEQTPELCRIYYIIGGTFMMKERKRFKICCIIIAVTLAVDIFGSILTGGMGSIILYGTIIMKSALLWYGKDAFKGEKQLKAAVDCSRLAFPIFTMLCIYQAVLLIAYLGRRDIIVGVLGELLLLVSDGAILLYQRTLKLIAEEQRKERMRKTVKQLKK